MLILFFSILGATGVAFLFRQLTASDRATALKLTPLIGEATDEASAKAAG